MRLLWNFTYRYSITQIKPKLTLELSTKMINHSLFLANITTKAQNHSHNTNTQD